jgi:hypothetical protein
LAYPNPASNYFYLKINDISGFDDKVFVYNSTGGVVFHDYMEAESKIDASQWTNGIYFIKAGNYLSKIMINK